MPLKVLFIGGTGIISSACSDLALEQGHDLHLMTRGQSFRPIPAGAKTIVGDINDSGFVEEMLREHQFDVVVNWIVFTPQQALRDIDYFSGKTDQYIFISSASAYQKPIQKLPITEETPLDNPYWVYSRNKQACEDALFNAFNKACFPITVVRPSHTYDKTLLPLSGGYTTLDRMLRGKPVIIHGDGTSLWVLTHHRDFAVGFNGLFGREEAIGEAYHITSDNSITWNAIYQAVADAAGVTLDPVYIPSTVIAEAIPDWKSSLLGDKSHSVIFDNSKIKGLVPDFNPQITYQEGSKETIAWYKEHPEAQVVNQELSAQIDDLIRRYSLP
jgi:nucleoside-diphosphate-sugar epimerase